MFTMGDQEAASGGPRPLSELQIRMVDFALEYRWDYLLEYFHLRSWSALCTMLKRTALGLYWVPGYQGRADFYLGEQAESRLVNILEVAAEEHHSLVTSQVLELATVLKRETQVQAYHALLRRGSATLARDVLSEPVGPPSRNWIAYLVWRLNLHLAAARTMDLKRCLACERSRIRDYFLPWMMSFNRNPRLIFGADKTDMRPGRSFKALVPQGMQGFVENDQPNSHLTAMCAHNAAGIVVPPMILLSDRARLPADSK